MTDTFKIITLIPVFVIVLVVAVKTLQPALGFGRTHSFILTVCVSMLSVLGIVHYLKDFTVLLLPYVVLVVAILVLLLFSFLGKSLKSPKDRVPTRISKKKILEMKDGLKKWL